MKTFSVQFFKRLILLVLVLLFLIPTGCAISLGIKCSNLEKQLAGGGALDPSQSPVPHPNIDPLPVVGEALDYQELYPELYSTAQLPEERYSKANTVYLTVNTSLNANTRQLLDTLDEYEVKATFFVSGSSDEEALGIMREIANRGHTIGLYSYSGDYTNIYKSVSSYLDDFKQIYDLVETTTGIKAEIFRFPGGSVNGYNSGLYRELIAEMLRRNYLFFDWSASTGDATNATDGANNILGKMESVSRGFLLIEDGIGQEFQVEAVPAVIEGLRERGYEFQPLTAVVKPVIFNYNSVE